MVSSIQVSAMDDAGSVKPGDKLVVKRTVSGVDVPMSVDGLQLTGTFIGLWAANTQYFSGNVISYAGVLYAATSTFRSGDNFDTASLTIISLAADTLRSLLAVVAGDLPTSDPGDGKSVWNNGGFFAISTKAS